MCLMVEYTFLILYFVDSLKMEIEKLANEKTEMQRHYVMVSLPILPTYSLPHCPAPLQISRPDVCFILFYITI